MTGPDESYLRDLAFLDSAATLESFSENPQGGDSSA
jgi:hypothetical protein